MYQYDIVKRSKTVIVVRETYDMYARYAYLLDANIASDLHRGKADIDRSAYGVANIGIKKQRIDTMHNATGNNDTYRQYRTGARQACVAYNAHSDIR